jgi:hemoglobin/transferrin/lactoferrin receptor protein
MLRLKLFLFVFYYLIVCEDLAFSQTLKIDSTKNLSEVIVTASRNKTQSLYVPYSFVSIHKKDLEIFQYRTTPEALSGSSGIFIQKTNHGGGSPFIRGLTGNQILLLSDGIRLNNSIFRYGPNQYFNTIDVYSISHIEAIKGTGSVQFGSDALGGVIQVFTKEPNFSPKKKLLTEVQLKAVTQKMEWTSHADMQYQTKKTAFLIGATIREFGDLYGGDTTGKQSPSAYKENAINGKFKYKINDQLVLTFAYQYLEQRDVPLYHKVHLENFNYYYFEPQKRQLGYARLEKTGKIKLLTKTTFTISSQKSNETRSYYKNNNVNRFIEKDQISTNGLTIDILSQLKKNWLANSGIEYYHDKVRSSREQITMASNSHKQLRGLYPDLATNANFSVYTLHHFQFNPLRIEAGLRYNKFNLLIPDTGKMGSNPTEIRIYPSSMVANLAALIQISSTQSLFASFSTGYRLPNIDDMGTLGLVDFRYELPTYDIKPEKSYNTEIGYRLMTQKALASISFYYMHLSDLITRAQMVGAKIEGYNVYKKQNNQESYLKGLDFSFSKLLFKKFKLLGNISYCFGQNLTKNEPLRRIPPLNGRFLATYEYKKFQLQSELLFAFDQKRLAQGDKEDNRIPAGGTPGWQIYNLSGSFKFQKMHVFTGIQNILNQDYRTHGSGINGMGRSLYLTLQFFF